MVTVWTSIRDVLRQILSGALIILTEVTCGFSQSNQANAGIVPPLVHDNISLVPYPFQRVLIIILSREGVTLGGGLDWILDLLTTLTHNSCHR
jgi:hypothetical protein